MACCTDLQELRLSPEFLIFVPHPREKIDALARQLLHPSRYRLIFTLECIHFGGASNELSLEVSL